MVRGHPEHNKWMKAGTMRRLEKIKEMEEEMDKERRLMKMIMEIERQ